MEFKETKLALSDPPRDQEQQEVKQPKQRVQPPQAQQRTPTTDRKAQKSAVKRPRDENSGSADAQKRYSEKLLGVQRKLFLHLPTPGTLNWCCLWAVVPLSPRFHRSDPEQ
jgi:hypothetical protein